MADKIKFTGTGDIQFKDEVHFVGIINDYTLCGLTMDLDPHTCGDYINTREKVNCRNCINITNYAKSIKRSEHL